MTAVNPREGSSDLTMLPCDFLNRNDNQIFQITGDSKLRHVKSGLCIVGSDNRLLKFTDCSWAGAWEYGNRSFPNKYKYGGMCLDHNLHNEKVQMYECKAKYWYSWYTYLKNQEWMLSPLTGYLKNKGTFSFKDMNAGVKTAVTGVPGTSEPVVAYTNEGQDEMIEIDFLTKNLKVHENGGEVKCLNVAPDNNLVKGSCESNGKWVTLPNGFQLTSRWFPLAMQTPSGTQCLTKNAASQNANGRIVHQLVLQKCSGDYLFQTMGPQAFKLYHKPLRSEDAPQFGSQFNYHQV